MLPIALAAVTLPDDDVMRGLDPRIHRTAKQGFSKK
jgi:hypothetical protein